ncbi:tripartite tricarboxylate transporter substrate binding protein [Aquabacterium sp. J223]|uniref:Bug family tripartite tricarboxylate transporter substrate binding protein n=1 Tax=Aquabacterium sp. J223 TaxID=2898431 RepID=UPI0021ADE3DF|nr:tripartite tricarboxylate transporter substrate binding protein [Aquabacterium sp. J223]UUX94929.1 tripartite tricarboxylate transporter substrate binding protein [Aquabacterium sp. J223]
MTASTPNRRQITLGAALGLLVPGAVRAQDNRSIEWVVGFAAGGGSDTVARTVAEAMARTLGQPIVVNNKPGAGTNIAAEYVVRAGNTSGTLLFTADFATLAANPFLFGRLPYDPVKDFVPVGLLARFPLLLVVAPNVPAKNWQEFTAWAKAQDNVSYASPGLGTPHHLAVELLRERTGLKFNHVPYKGAAPAVQDLMGGQVPVGMIDSASVQQAVVAGRVKAIGVASAARLQTLPDVPTLAEQGVSGYEAYAWQGLVAPAGTPPDTVARFSKALQAALDATPVKARFQSLALEALPGTPQQMASYAGTERERWGRLIKANNIRLD